MSKEDKLNEGQIQHKNPHFRDLCEYCIESQYTCHVKNKIAASSC
mgnify:CR=1 FL=1